MIISRVAHEDGSQSIVIGLSPENIRQLSVEHDIVTVPKVHRDAVPKGWNILLVAGETEHSIRDQLVKAGVIHANTLTTSGPHLPPDWPK